MWLRVRERKVSKLKWRERFTEIKYAEKHNTTTHCKRDPTRNAVLLPYLLFYYSGRSLSPPHISSLVPPYNLNRVQVLRNSVPCQCDYLTFLTSVGKPIETKYVTYCGLPLDLWRRKCVKLAGVCCLASKCCRKITTNEGTRK